MLCSFASSGHLGITEKLLRIIHILTLHIPMPLEGGDVFLYYLFVFTVLRHPAEPGSFLRSSCHGRKACSLLFFLPGFLLVNGKERRLLIFTKYFFGLERNKYSFVTLTHHLSGLSLRYLLPRTMQGSLCSCLEPTQSPPQITD